MKKIKYLITSLILVLIFSSVNVFAAGSISVSSSSKTVIVGNTVKVTVKVNGLVTFKTVNNEKKVNKNGVGTWEYCISYDSSLLKLTSSTADAYTCVKTGLVGLSKQSETFTFKALKSGTANVGVKSFALYDYEDETQMKSSAGSVSIKLMTQSELQATYSTNANLKGISVDSYKLDPSFKKDVFVYNVDVENDVEKVTISASKEDSTASISGTGTKSLSEGLNKFEIIVTSQKGNTLTYTVNVNRKELNPITVTIDGKEYTIIRKADDLPIDDLNSFQEDTLEYDSDTIIPVLKSEVTGFTVVGLKDSEGNIHMFIYDDGFTKEYIEVKTAGINLYPMEFPESEKFGNYTKTTVDFNEVKVDAYKLNDNAKTVIIYGQDTDLGDVRYYFYDLETGSLIPYNEDLDTFYVKKIDTYKKVILGSIGFIVFLILIMFLRKPKKVFVEKVVTVEKEKVVEKEPVKEEKNEEVTDSFKPIDIIEIKPKRGRKKKIDE